MKKLILTLMLLFPFLTGCSNINANIDILNNKTVLFSADLYSNKNTTEDEVLLIKENFETFIDKSYITDISYSNKSAKISAIKLARDIKRNDIDLSSIGFKTNLPSKRFVDVKQNLFVTLFNIDLIYDLPAQQSRITKETVNKNKKNKGLTPEYLQKYGDKDISLDNPEETIKNDFRENTEDDSVTRREVSQTNEQDNQNYDTQDNMNISDLSPVFSITLPSLASFNNADRQADNVYYWNIKNDEPTNIKLQYIVYNSFAITILLILALIILYFMTKSILKYETQKRIDSDK